MNGPFQELPGEIVYRYGERAPGNDHLETVVRQTYLADQALGIVEPLPGTHVALSIAAGPFRACDEVDLSGSGFEGLKKMQGLYPSAARHRKESDSGPEFLLEGSSVGVLFGVELPTEEDRDVCFRLIGYHVLATIKKGRPIGRRPVVASNTPMCRDESITRQRAAVNSIPNGQRQANSRSIHKALEVPEEYRRLFLELFPVFRSLPRDEFRVDRRFLFRP